MYVVGVSYGPVQVTVGVGTVFIWDFSIAITRGCGVTLFGDTTTRPFLTTETTHVALGHRKEHVCVMLREGSLQLS